MRHLFAVVLFSACVASTLLKPLADAAPQPAGWIDLMKPDAWKRVDPQWIFARSVKLDPEKPNKLLTVPAANGGIWVNGLKGRLPNLITKEQFGDCEIHVEYLLAQRSNAGVKFHEVYEIQFLDSFGKTKLTGSGNGGIYPRANLKKGGYLDQGVPPKVNASKPAGEWQTLDVLWKSPRFNPQGEKTSHATVIKAVLNGQVIHENVELKTPTGGNWARKEQPKGSLMIQTDHGPTAIRNVRIRPLK